MTTIPAGIITPRVGEIKTVTIIIQDIMDLHVNVRPIMSTHMVVPFLQGTMKSAE